MTDSHPQHFRPAGSIARTVRVVLLGHDARNDNLGVGALTVAQVRLLDDIATRLGIALDIRVLDGGGARPDCIPDGSAQELVVRPLRQPGRLLSALRESDVVIDISGGDSFADIYGRKRLSIIFLQKALCHLLGRPLVMAPQTIGPFTGRLWRLMAAQTLRRAKIVATRDGKSTRFVRELGVSRPVIEASDIALRLPYEPPPPRPGGKTAVGLNVSGLLMRGGYTGGNMFGLTLDYPALMRRVIAAFTALGDGVEVHLVPHVLAWSGDGMEDDLAASRALAAEFPGVIVAPAFATPSEAKSYIAGMDFFMGARMHACIGALSSGVPVVPMAYSRKFEGLFGSLGYHHTVDCTRDGIDDILHTVLASFEDRARLKSDVDVALEKGLERLKAYEHALEEMLAGIAFQ